MIGTRQLLFQLLVFIQGESHPIYRMSSYRSNRYDKQYAKLSNTSHPTTGNSGRSQQTAGTSANTPLNIEWPVRMAGFFWRGGIYILLILAIIVSILFGGPTLLYTPFFQDQILAMLVFLGGFLFSLTWMLLPGMLAGQSISYMQGEQTWDMLATTPYSSDTVLLARAASDLRFIWGALLACVALCVIIALPAAGYIAFVQLPSGGLSILWAAIITAITVIGTAIERLQELALSVVIGILAGVITRSNPLMLLTGFLAVVGLRCIQITVVIFLCLKFIPSASAALTPSIVAIVPVVGTSTLWASTMGLLVPTMISTLTVIMIIIAREMLIRVLFRYAAKAILDRR